MNNKKDFFISYNNKDKQWATWIAGILEYNGYTTIIQAWDFRPGNNFVLEMQSALVKCRKTILVLSQNYLDSVFCQSEWASAFCNDPTGIERTLIPVRIDNISPPGLLSQIVYIDLYNCSEESAAMALLDGVADKCFSRKRPEFPGKNKKSVSRVRIHKSYEFIFIISKDNISEIIPARTKNSLREWFVKGCKEDFTVTIQDKLIDISYGYLAEIIQKIQNEQVLTLNEENTYNQYMRTIKKCEHEIELKKKACEIFLRDSVIHTYFSISSPTQLYTFIVKIMDYDYDNDKRKKMNDELYCILDFSISPPSKECHNYFTVPLKRTKIQEVFGTITNWQIRGRAIDLGSDLLEEVIVYYYYFLAEEIVYFNMNKITENEEVMNLLNYQINLH